MEKLDKVIAALEGIYGDRQSPSYGYPKPYGVFHYDAVCEDALELLKEYRDLKQKTDILRAELAEERERSARWLRESEPVVHAHWDGDWCSRCGELAEENYPRCPYCGAHMDEQLELRTCYCPICDKHFEVRSNDSGGSCPDCGHHVVLHRLEEVTE